ncbi:hypothetical protein IW262DRAFT_1484482 [Armillaria fumosa]|nr:hypothetical protein IW262DRAFT_1484482 [Armillaria fumosa]
MMCQISPGFYTFTHPLINIDFSDENGVLSYVMNGRSKAWTIRERCDGPLRGVKTLSTSGRCPLQRPSSHFGRALAEDLGQSALHLKVIGISCDSRRSPSDIPPDTHFRKKCGMDGWMDVLLPDGAPQQKRADLLCVYGTEPYLCSAAMVKPPHEYSLTASAIACKGNGYGKKKVGRERVFIIPNAESWKMGANGTIGSPSGESARTVDTGFWLSKEYSPVASPVCHGQTGFFLKISIIAGGVNKRRTSPKNNTFSFAPCVQVFDIQDPLSS